MKDRKVRLEATVPKVQQTFTIFASPNITCSQVASLVLRFVHGENKCRAEDALVLTKTGRFLNGNLLVRDTELNNGDEILIS